MQSRDAQRNALCGRECGRTGRILLFLLEPFPLQRLERIQPLKSQMIKLGTVQSLNL